MTSPHDFILEELRYSYSSLSSFNQCRYGFYLTYIEAKERSNNFFGQFGTFVHEIMEKFFKMELESFELLEYYKDNYKKNVFLSPPPYPPNMAQNYYKYGYNFFGNFSFERDDYEVLAIEGKYDDALEDIKIVVKPDLVLKNKKTGEAILLDYKTSNIFKQGKKIDEDKLNGYIKQTRMYSAFLQRHGIKIDKIKIWFIRTDSFIEVECGDNEIPFSWIKETVDSIKKEEEWHATPSKYFCDNLCSVSKFCSFKNLDNKK